MAARELTRNYNTNFCTFYIDAVGDIVFLPTNNRSGTGDLILSKPCIFGSVARDMSGTYYTLNGSNEWVEYASSAYIVPEGKMSIDVASDGEVDYMLDDLFNG